MIIVTNSMAKKHVIVIFSSLSKHIFSHFSKLISQPTEAAVQVLLGKHVLKIRSKLKREGLCRSVVLAALLKSHLSMDILLQALCIFSERLFIRGRSHLEVCF